MPRDYRYGLTLGGISRHTPVLSCWRIENKKGRFIFFADEAAFCMMRKGLFYEKVNYCSLCLIVIAFITSITLSQAQEFDDPENEPEMTCGDQMATPKPKKKCVPKIKIGTSINKNKDNNGKKDGSEEGSMRCEVPKSK